MTKDQAKQFLSSHDTMKTIAKTITENSVSMVDAYRTALRMAVKMRGEPDWMEFKFQDESVICFTFSLSAVADVTDKYAETTKD